MGLFNIFSKKEHKEDLDKGLEKTKEGVFSKLARAVAGKSKVDEAVSYTHLTLPTTTSV